MPRELSFICTSGCGECRIRLADFETFRHETLDGQLIERRTVPQVVSTCCGAAVEVWDERKQDVVGTVGVSVPGGAHA